MFSNYIHLDNILPDNLIIDGALHLWRSFGFHPFLTCSDKCSVKQIPFVQLSWEMATLLLLGTVAKVLSFLQSIYACRSVVFCNFAYFQPDFIKVQAHYLDCMAISPMCSALSCKAFMWRMRSGKRWAMAPCDWRPVSTDRSIKPPSVPSHSMASWPLNGAERKWRRKTCANSWKSYSFQNIWNGIPNSMILTKHLS